MKSFRQFLFEVQQGASRPGYTRLYHGTDSGAAAEIHKGGFRTDKNVTRQMRGAGVYATTDPKAAQMYANDRAATRGTSPHVLSFEVPNHMLAGKGADVTKGSMNFKAYGMKPDYANQVLNKPNIPAVGNEVSTTNKIAGMSRQPTMAPKASAPAGMSRQPTIAPKASTPTSPTLPKEPTAAPKVGTPTSAVAKDAEVAANAAKGASKMGKALSIAGHAAGALGAAADAADEYKTQRARGRSQGSSAALGATKAAGGWAGAEVGAETGAAIGSLAGPVGTAVGGLAGGIAGYYGGSKIAGKAGEIVSGATGKEKTAMATANRQSQAGGALKGVGGSTSFDTKKNTISSGGRTAQLGKTSVVTGPGGKQDVGYLAYKNGQAVYKRAPDPSTLAQTSSNPLERIGRSLFAGAYKQSDAANAAKNLAAARQSDVARNKALGVKLGPSK